MPRIVAHRIWLAKLNRPPQLTIHSRMHGDVSAEILAALDPDRRFMSHRKEWRLSKPYHVGTAICGKLGYTRPTAAASIYYDEVQKDFVTTRSPVDEAHFAFFAINPHSQFIAFEERKPDLTRDNFLRVLRKLLDGLFEVAPVSDEKDYRKWLADIDVVTYFKATIRPANPDPRRRPEEVKALVEESRADKVTLEASTNSRTRGQGLMVNDSILGAAAEHAVVGNGDFQLRGLAHGTRRFFDSAKRLVSDVIQITRDDSEADVFARLADLVRQWSDDIYDA